MVNKNTGAPSREVDIVIIGAGIGGIYALYRLRQLGLSVCAIEAGSGVGGTWFWNSYPDARCDVESMQYSYSFSSELEQEWKWPERYGAQPDLLAYLNHVTDRFDLRSMIQFNTRVTSAQFDENENRWVVTTDGGEILSAKYCVMATGNLSVARVPEFKGLEHFEGDCYHTGRWPKEKVDFTGKRVGVIGTGSSGIQLIPEVAKEASQVYVFQRTANFCVPAGNRVMDDETDKTLKASYRQLREMAQNTPFCMGGHPPPVKGALEASHRERKDMYEARWKAGGAVNFLYTYKDLLTNSMANETAGDFVKEQIRKIVRNPQLAELLCPNDHYIGTRRLCVSDHYFQTYNRPNVALVDVRKDPIVAIMRNGLRTDTAEYELDAIIFATGFDAITGALAEIDIRGPGGATLRQAWQSGPRCFLGLMVAGFPNMFLVTGPQSPSVKANVVCAIEQHVDWIADCLETLRARDVDRIAVTPEAQERWVAHCNEVANSTLYATTESWYTGANVPGKPRVFAPYVGGFAGFRQKCDAVAAAGYKEFEMLPAKRAADTAS